MNESLEQVLKPREAKRQQAKASILIEGLSGSGKSGLALLLAYGLAGKDWTKICATDTENKSLDLFDGTRMSTGIKCDHFKKIDLLPTYGYSPQNYLLCKSNAIDVGAEVVINDSLTHMWHQEGGVLDLVTQVQLSNNKLNNYTAWGTNEVKTEKQAVYACIRDARVHVISTVRVKEKFDIVPGEGLNSLGEQEMMMPDLKYEPDLVLHMMRAGAPDGTAPIAKVIKTRYTIFKRNQNYQFTPDIIDSLVSYLNEGADPEELMEKQRQDYINTISGILDSDISKKTMFPLLKEQQGHKDTKLIELPLDVLQTLLGTLLA